jgi:hypothetical protein
MTLEIVQQTMIDKQCAIRLGAPGKDGKFAVAAIAGNGAALAAGYGKTLKDALRDMLKAFKEEEEETCVPIAA